jgi:predicted nucleic acid-binding protein
LGQPDAIVDALRSTRRIGIDTPVFIYHIQQASPRASAATAVLRAVADGRVEGVTSVITMLEVTIQPLRLGRPHVADAYEALLGTSPICLSWTWMHG